ncbi:MAG: NADH dehydrogenase [Deltaproteobacteria bacterium RIFOXYD12_FULL_50_9]|nr:MAG: NADH dehydrogenase [Deltaproteobacteria bacterium RIFOXYD12_FULL_50_9]
MTKATDSNDNLADILAQYTCENDSLIPILQAVQQKIGYLPEESIGEISSYLGISQSEIFGVATFYTKFKFARSGDHQMRVCLGTACHVRGGGQIMDEAARALGIEAGGTTPDYKFSLERVACFGSCALAPVIVVDDKVYGRMTPKKVKTILKEFE